MKFQDQTVLIIGGGSGIGWAMTEAFYREGAKVYVLEIDAETAQRKVEEAGHTSSVKCVPCDVSREESVRDCIGQIISESGRIDVLINNAGVAHIGTALTTTGDDMDRIYRVNIKGVYHCIHAVLPYMIERKKGVILNMASVAASVGIADRFAYSASKGAVLTMTYQVAKDFVRDGIRCNSISPGRVHTPFVDGYLRDNYPGREKEMYDVLSATHPIGRMAQPAEVASLAVFLCSEEAGFITGTDYPLDGGFIRLNS